MNIKDFFRLNLENGMGKSARKTKTRKLGGVPGWILGRLGWPIICPVVGFWRRFLRALLPVLQVYVVFRLFCG
jgi:hypothetical protein